MHAQQQQQNVGNPVQDAAKLRAAAASMRSSMGQLYEELNEKREQYRRASLLAEAMPDMKATRDALKAEIDGIERRIDDLSAGLSYASDCIKDAELQAIEARAADDWRRIDALLKQRDAASEQLLLALRRAGEHYAKVTSLGEEVLRVVRPHIPVGQIDRARLNDVTIADLARLALHAAGGSFCEPNSHRTQELKTTVADYTLRQSVRLLELAPYGDKE